MKKTKVWLNIHFCFLSLLPVLAGFNSNAKVEILAVGLDAEIAAGPDAPDIGGYVVGDPGDSVIEVYPTGGAPPSGSIVALAKSSHANGNAFSINDQSYPGRLAIRFYIKKTAVYTEPTGGIPIDISATSISTAAQVAYAIATTINSLGNELYLHANAPQSSGTDGKIYLSYDYASDPFSNGNGVEIWKDVLNPFPAEVYWIPGGLHNDLQHVQWAVNNVLNGGTVLLKQYSIATTIHTPFNFGIIGNIYVNRDVTIQGECASKETFSDVGSGGWILSGTTILGGTQMPVGIAGAVSFSIKDIIFDGFYAGAIRVKSTKGYNEISGCQFRNFVRGRTFRGNTNGAFPIVADGGLTAPEIEGLTGSLKIANNFFGKPASPIDAFNNLMHFSNCNLELEISENEIEDACWGGFLVFGNKGHSRITRNTINKTKSFMEGAAISVGLTTSIYFTPFAYNGSAEIADNKITIGSANTSGIMIVNYPLSQYAIPIPEGISYVVSGNRVIMNNSQRYALACMGACSHSTWGNNTVTGEGYYGICLAKPLPSYAPQPNDDAYVSDNQFVGNHFEGFTAKIAQAYLDQYSQYNYFGPDSGYDPGNAFGSLWKAYINPGQLLTLGIYIDDGKNNICAHNDFSKCKLYDQDGNSTGYVPGWQAPEAIGCILLSPTSSRAEVYEHAKLGTRYFPPGTTLCSQLLDLGSANVLYQFDKLCVNPLNPNLTVIWAKWAAHQLWKETER